WRVEEHAVAGPAPDHAALDLLLLGVPNLDPHLPPRLGEGRRHSGEGDVLLQARRPEGGGGEAELLPSRPIGMEEGAGGGLAALDLDADQDVARAALCLLLLQRPLADEVAGLLRAHGPADAGLDGRLALARTDGVERADIVDIHQD